MNLKDKRIAIKKPHRCWGCAEQFPVGTFMQYTSGVNQGDFYSCYWCEICNAFFKQMEDSDDGICMGDFRGEEVYEIFKQNYLKNETIHIPNRQ